MATFTATAEPVDGRIRLNLNWADEPTVVSATIVRTDPDGRDRAVRNAEPALLSSGVGLIYDHEAPFNEPVSYSAWSVNSANILAAGPTTLTSSRVWLKHPLLPTLNKPVTVHTAPELTYRARRTLHRVLGRADPVAVTDVREGASGSIAFLALTAADVEELVTLFEDGSVLLLAGLPEFNIGTWFISAGDVTYAKTGRMVQDPIRVVTVPFDIVERPAGNAGGAVDATYAEVLNVYASYAALRAGETDYLDLLSGVGT